MKKKDVTFLIVILSSMSVNIFYSTTTIARFDSTNYSSNLLYVIYNIFVFCINFIFLFLYNFLKNNKISIKEFKVLLFPLLLSICFCLDILFRKSVVVDEEINSYFYFLLWSLPAIIAAIYVDQNQLHLKFIKWIEIIIILFSISNGISLFTSNSLTEGSVINFDGKNQMISYISALSYGLTLFILFYGSSYRRFKFTENKIYFYLLSMTLFLNFISVITSGGRGGFVLVMLYSCIFLFIYLKPQKILKKIFLVIVLTSISAYIYNVFLKTNLTFNAGFIRATEFVTSDNLINWSNTSNRDVVYDNAIKLIYESPILGYGIFSLWRHTSNPHNIFLELILGIGIIPFLLIVLPLFMVLILKLMQMISIDSKNLFWLIFILYPFTMLQFSGSYLWVPEFWFCITIIYLYSKKVYEGSE